MQKYLKKTFFFLFYFVNILHLYLKGLLISKTKIIFSISRFHFLFFISFVKYNLLANFSSLLDIIVVDHINSNSNRFEITYIFWNIFYSQRFGIKLYTTHLNGITSISHYYANANWLEREVWDMFGIKFFMHPNLSRILTDYGFQGFPLRKDFPLCGYIDLFYDYSLQVILYMPLELGQKMRFFNIKNPWVNNNYLQ